MAFVSSFAGPSVKPGAGTKCSVRRVLTPGRQSTPRARGTVHMGLFDMFGNKEAADWTMEAGYASYPMVGKTRGEDAFYIEGNSMGVFDGVRGAAGEENDPQAFSQFLAVNTSSGVRRLGLEKVSIALNEAAELNPEVGASTACVVSMDRLGRLVGTNLGDSGVCVARDGKVAFRTEEQSHFFNCPYQLGSQSEDTVAMGKNVRFQLKLGDWIILASDGLWDNVYQSEIVQIITDTVTTVGIDPSAVANSLAQTAVEKSALEAYTSPFAVQAKKAGQTHRGGKLDDVTVLASYVTRDAPAYSMVSA